MFIHAEVAFLSVICGCMVASWKWAAGSRICPGHEGYDRGGAYCQPRGPCLWFQSLRARGAQLELRCLLTITSFDRVREWLRKRNLSILRVACFCPAVRLRNS